MWQNIIILLIVFTTIFVITSLIQHHMEEVIETDRNVRYNTKFLVSSFAVIIIYYVAHIIYIIQALMILVKTFGQR